MKLKLSCLTLLFGTTLIGVLAAEPDLIVADFEQSTYGDWKVTGEAFGSAPAQGTLPSQMPVSGFLGRGLVNSFHGGDATTGKLVSPDFEIRRKYISFLIGGGGFEGKTCMNLIVDGQVVRSATGPNTKPGGSEELAPASWEVSEHAGKSARIEIVDEATGGWGHINVDQIVQTDARAPLLLTNASKEILANKRYLILPVKNGAAKRTVTLEVANQPVRQFEIELADTAPDWWAFMDLTPFRNRRALLKVDKLRGDSAALQLIQPSDEIKGAENLYQEPLRPQFHFSSRRGWNNDPNGLVFYEGEYHLFYQHNPYGWSWGNMHWGHAVSSDLVHWTELPEALYPDEHGTMFSGSAVVDWNNTAKLRKGREKTLVCMFTAAGKPFTQGLAYSNDRGRTWTKYPGNPVLDHIVAENRDPKVIWYQPEKKWVMALYLDKNDFALFGSKDLKSWTRLCDVKIPDCTECPEFFELAVDGKSKDTRWVFYGGNGRYLIGTFDGKNFVQESGPHVLNYGNCFYASQTFNDIPKKDGRRIMIPWGQMATPGMPFNQMMGLPVELTLKTTEAGLRLFVNPVVELNSLRGPLTRFPVNTLKPGTSPLKGATGELMEIIAEFRPGEAIEVGLVVRGVQVSYDARREELACGAKRSPLAPVNGSVRLHLFVDRTSIDIFGNDGALYMPMGMIVPANNQEVELYAKGGNAQLVSLDFYPLNSAWK